MPEGPQVHLVAQKHHELLSEKKIAFASPDGRSTELAEAFNGRTLHKVTAVGKHLLYYFSPDYQLHIHLGRFGKFRTGELPLPDEQTALRFCMSSRKNWVELRGAVAIEHYAEDDVRRLTARLGPDPLNHDSPDAGFEKISKRRTPIGQLLMDQSIIAGIGNIFRAEMLFRAGVSPFRPGGKVEREILRRMWDDVTVLMQYSLEHAGRIVTTEPHDRQYPKRANVARPDAFYVYHRTGKPCRHCGTPIEQEAMGGRTVFYCPHCQAD